MTNVTFHPTQRVCTKTVSERRNFVDNMKVLFPSFIHTCMTIMNQCKVILNLDHKNGKVLNDIMWICKNNMSKTWYENSYYYVNMNVN